MTRGERLFWTGEERRVEPRHLLLLVPLLATLLPVALTAVAWYVRLAFRVMRFSS